MCSSRRTREESAYKSRNFFNLEKKSVKGSGDEKVCGVWLYKSEMSVAERREKRGKINIETRKPIYIPKLYYF